MGKKKFINLEILQFTLLYLQSEGRSVNSPLGVRGVLEHGGSSRLQMLAERTVESW